MSRRTAVAVGPWLSALDVSFRDVNHTGSIPEKGAFCIGLNPLAEVIALGYPGTTNVIRVGMMLFSLLMIVGLLIGRIIFFRQMERTFADEI